MPVEKGRMDSRPWLRVHTSCSNCLHGHHDECLGYPQGRRFEPKEKRIDKPCECANRSHPEDPTCYIFSRDDWGSQRCGRPAKGKTRSNRLGGRRANNPEVPACGIHIAAYKRLVANDERRAAESKARREKWDRQEAASKASRDWAEKFRTEFGIEAEPVSGSEYPRIKLSPEPLYAQLLKISDMLDEVYAEHPFKQ